MVDILSPYDGLRRSGRGGSEPLRDRLRPTDLDFSFPRRQERSSADLVRMIEGEIIPRLMLAHSSQAGSPSTPFGVIGPSELDTFVRLAVVSESAALTAYAEGLIGAGASLEAVYVDLLIPAARRLGDDWNDDLISFTDVTIGLCRLQQVVRDLGRLAPRRDSDPGAPSACFVPAPGEQHTFGLVILEDGFRRAGWRTWLDTAASAEDAREAVAQDWFDVFGLSATSDASLDLVASTIAKVRRSSRNRRLFVMVGGGLFLETPGLAARVGADAASGTAVEALRAAGKAVKARAFV